MTNAAFEGNLCPATCEEVSSMIFPYIFFEYIFMGYVAWQGLNSRQQDFHTSAFRKLKPCTQFQDHPGQVRSASHDLYREVSKPPPKVVFPVMLHTSHASLLNPFGNMLTCLIGHTFF